MSQEILSSGREDDSTQQVVRDVRLVIQQAVSEPLSPPGMFLPITSSTIGTIPSQTAPGVFFRGDINSPFHSSQEYQEISAGHHAATATMNNGSNNVKFGVRSEDVFRATVPHLQQQLGPMVTMSPSIHFGIGSIPEQRPRLPGPAATPRRAPVGSFGAPGLDGTAAQCLSLVS